MRIKTHWDRLLIASPLLAAFSLGACSSGKTPSPPLALPQLPRQVLVLHTKGPTVNVLIPRAAFIKRGGIPGVFVLRNGLARFRMVRVGKTQGEDLEILSGLSGNETLILGNLTDVHDGSPITVK